VKSTSAVTVEPVGLPGTTTLLTVRESLEAPVLVTDTLGGFCASQVSAVANEMFLTAVFGALAGVGVTVSTAAAGTVVNRTAAVASVTPEAIRPACFRA
jgi:hypothetical protein